MKIESKKITVPILIKMKQKGEKIAALTAYDFLSAALLDESGMDLILVGDSLAMVFAGHETTIPITMDEMIYHTKIVRRGVKRALFVADLPFLSYQISPEEAMRNAGRLMKEGGAEAVKMEGGEPIAATVKKLVQVGIPVMGHLGLTPQSIHKFGGYVTQGKKELDAQRLLKDAQILEQAGAFSIVLEKIPAKLGREISESLTIPTIGIGGGNGCDGQIVVTADMLGFFEKFKPKFVRRYAEIGNTMREAFNGYIRDVKNGSFPDESESF